MTVMLLTEHNLEFLNLKGGSTGSSESTLVKVPHCWKSHVVAQLLRRRNRAKTISLPTSFWKPRSQPNEIWAEENDAEN